MTRFAVSYTKAMNQRYDRVGTPFQGPFKSKHVNQNDYLIHLPAYIHLNPVEARLVRSAEEWECSSYLEYLGARQDPLLTTGPVLSHFPSREAYRECVESWVADGQEMVAHLLVD